jgi:DNA-binding transcriptional MerR regulator
MTLKMKELMLLTGESKSTILYYIKEGLLPEPSKPKPNVHLYDINCVQIIKFIKYLQHSFSYSISEIQAIFNDNKFNFDGSFESMVKSLELISGGRDNVWYTREDFLELVEMNSEELSSYQKRGFLFERSKGFSSKEVEVAEIVKRAKQLGLDFALFDTYVEHAKILATRENEVGSELLSIDNEAHNSRYELLFDIILTLKSYIFNMHTVQEHQKSILKEK